MPAFWASLIAAGSDRGGQSGCFCKGPDALSHWIREPLFSALGSTPSTEKPIDWVFSVYISFFLRIFFCQCFDIIAKTSKMFGRMASACFTEQPRKLGISVNLRLFEWNSCGARYRELEEQACLGCMQLFSLRKLAAFSFLFLFSLNS